MSTTARATLDRIVDGEQAVFLVQGEEGVTDEVVLDVHDVPEDGRQEGAVFDVRFTGTELDDLEYLPEESDQRRDEAQDRLDRLSSPFGADRKDDQ